MLSGLIWTIQLVHYPSFLDVGADEYIRYQQNHMKNISLLVMPLMLLELGAGIYLQVEQIESDLGWLIYLATFLLLIIWVVTVFAASPLHSKLLNEGYDRQNIKRLIDINWIRTFAWSGRTAIYFLLLLIK